MTKFIKIPLVSLILAAFSAQATVKVDMDDPGIRMYTDGLADILEYKDSPVQFFATGLIAAQVHSLRGHSCEFGKTRGATLDKVATYYHDSREDLSHLESVEDLNERVVVNALHCRVK